MLIEMTTDYDSESEITLRFLRQLMKENRKHHWRNNESLGEHEFIYTLYYNLDSDVPPL